ncbi:MAG: hypothetical protein K2X29_13645, partial [Candidatus Obscuribacterales bacterium]|nr:hypothetical protein [Candidatus Obscuribacterales bacterium]
MTDVQLGQLITLAANTGIFMGCLTFFIVLYQVPRNKQLNSWLATNLYTIFRTVLVLMLIPIAGAFVDNLAPVLQVVLIALLAYLSPVLFLVVALMSDGVPPIKRKLDVAAVVKELEVLYPGKNIILSPPDKPTEIICEIERSNGYSKIVAVTEISEPHYHLISTEHYKVLRGRLKVHTQINGKKYPPEVLAPGLTTTVPPNVI